MKRFFHIIIYIFAAIGFAMVCVYGALQLGLTNTKGIVDNQHDYFKNQLDGNPVAKNNSDGNGLDWSQGDDWKILKEAILKDHDVIFKAASMSGISPRTIVSILIVEQLRLFHSNREVFKSVFAPLKILGNQSQFSWGVMGIKQDTAIAIEAALKNPTSDFYLGTRYEHLLDYPTTTTSTSEIDHGTSVATDIDAARFARLTDEHDRYYSYLYGGIYVREIMAQWQKAGIPIDDKPDVIATLFNIGFNNSHPHPNPYSGGAEIETENQTYSFGSLAKSFYESSELITEFPR